MRLLAALLLIPIASAASALSCLAPDPVRTFLEVDASEDQWGAAVGRLDFNEAALPQVDFDGTVAAETWVRAQLVGKTLTRDGWTKPFQGNVSIQVTCAGSWCGQPQSGASYLMFLKREPTRFTAIADPCSNYIFPATRENMDRVHQCFTGGPCAAG